MSLYSKAFDAALKKISTQSVDEFIPPELTADGHLNRQYLEMAKLVVKNQAWIEELKIRIRDHMTSGVRAKDDETRNRALGALDEINLLMTRFEILVDMLKDVVREEEEKEKKEEKDAEKLNSYEPNVI